MLNEITIENVAVIEKATASFADGFTVLTGETGAGKSMLIDSINAILGNRTSRDVVRHGAAKAVIWASFSEIGNRTEQALASAGYENEDVMLLNREISAEGKSTCRVNGLPATAAVLKELCGGLVNIHGQHDNQDLLNPARHIDILDAFAQNEALLVTYVERYSAWSKLHSSMDQLQMDESEKARRLDLLRYEADEIDAAALQPDEEEHLLERREMVRNAQHILDALNSSYTALSGGEEDMGAVTLLAAAARDMSGAAAFASDLASYADSLNEIYYTAGEIASDLQGRLTEFEFDERAVDSIEQRLDVIYRLKQKYGATVEAVLAYGEKARRELEQIESAEERLAALQQQEKAAAKAMQALAEQLTESRKEAFVRLDAEIQDALAFLNMPNIRMDLQIKQVAPGPKGQDMLEFYIATNAGELPKPLAKIASGGELARIMLAIKSALADRDAIPTVIYDEIDTGISGLAAGRVGQMLRDTAKGKQVICVTHTAQIAAYAQRHLLIEKKVVDGRTYTSIRALEEAERVEELARIISGDHVTDLARANAAEMLRLAAEEMPAVQ